MTIMDVDVYRVSIIMQDVWCVLVSLWWMRMFVHIKSHMWCYIDVMCCMARLPACLAMHKTANYIECSECIRGFICEWQNHTLTRFWSNHGLSCSFFFIQILGDIYYMIWYFILFIYREKCLLFVQLFKHVPGPIGCWMLESSYKRDNQTHKITAYASMLLILCTFLEHTV